MTRSNIVYTHWFLIIFMVLANGLVAIGQEQQTRSGGIFDLYGSGAQWYTPSNAAAPEYYSTRSEIWGMTNSSFIKATNFGFTIPAGSTINGILVEVRPNANSSAIMDNSIRISKGGLITGNDQARPSDVSWPSYETFSLYIRYGGLSNLWGVSWTPSDINNSGFGCSLSAKNIDPDPDAQWIAYIDHIRITVFYTSPPAPLAPTLALPVNGASNVSTSPILSWDASTGATSYRLQVSTSSNFTTTIFDQSSISSTSHRVTGLSYSTSYYWRVNATASGGTSEWSSVRSFSTTPPPPIVPMLASPSDGTITPSTSPTLSWDASVDASSYRLQVSTDSSYASLILDDSTLTVTSKEIGPLYSGAMYFWHVSATNAAGTSDWSQMASLVTEGPAPALAEPSDATSSETELQLLVWVGSPYAQQYWVQVSTTPEFSSVLFEKSTTATSMRFGAKSGSRTYYWRARMLLVPPGVGPVLSPWSTVWSFYVNSPRPRILFTGSDIGTVRDKWNYPSGSFPFSDFGDALARSKWTGPNVPNSNFESADFELADYDRQKAKWAKVLAFRYMMDPTNNEIDGDLAKNYLHDLNVGNNYVIDQRFDRWMTNGLALIDYSIAYDLLEGAGYFGEDYSTRTAILMFLLERAQSLGARAKNDRTLAEFWRDVITCTTKFDISELGIHWEVCSPDFGSIVAQEARFHATLGNIRIIVASALGVAANASIADATTSQEWLRYAQTDVEHFLLNQDITDPNKYAPRDGFIVESQNVDGAFPEGISYLNYAAEGFVPFFIANKINGGRDYSQEPNFKKLLDWTYDVQLPTGDAPQLGSSAFKTYPLSSLFGTAIPTSGGNYMWQLERFTQNEHLTVGLPVEGFCLLNGPPPPLQKLFSTTTILPTQGQVIYRDAPTTPNKYLLISAKNGRARYVAGNHAHAEAGSFIYGDGDKLLVRHPGYSGFPSSAEYEKATSHSTVCPVVDTVCYDGTDRLVGMPPRTDVTVVGTKSTSEFNFTNTAFELKSLGWTEPDAWGLVGFASGYSNLKFAHMYSGLLKTQLGALTYGNCNRRFLMVNNSYLIVRDGITRTDPTLQYAVSFIQGNNGDQSEVSWSTRASAAMCLDCPSSPFDVTWETVIGGTVLRVNSDALGGMITQFSGLEKGSHQNTQNAEVAYHARLKTACSFNENNYGQILSILESDPNLSTRSSVTTNITNRGFPTFANYLLYKINGIGKSYGRFDVVFSQAETAAQNLSVLDLPWPITTDAKFLVMSFSSNYADVNSIRIFASNASYINYGGYSFTPLETGDSQISFNVLAPLFAAPTLASPANGATGVTVSPTLVWNASAGASTYHLQVATDVNFNSLVINRPNIAGTSSNVGLDYNTTYYWRVKAVNTGGESAWSSPTWNFTTEIQHFTLTINSPCGLPTNPSPGQHSYVKGTSVTVCVTSTVISGESGTQYAFTNWSGDADGTNACVTVTMDGDRTVNVGCKTQYYLTVNDNLGLGTSGEGWYDDGGTATACVNGTTITYGSTRFLLDYWYVDASGSNQCVNITMNSPKTARAFFRIQYWLEMSMSGPCGSISPSTGWYYADDAVQINAYTSGNCVFLGWSGSGSGSTSSSYPTAYVEMAEPISQHATFDYACVERSAPPWAYSSNDLEFAVIVQWGQPSGTCPLSFNIYRQSGWGGNWELIAQGYSGLSLVDYPPPYDYGWNTYYYRIVTVSTTGQEIGEASAEGAMYY